MSKQIPLFEMPAVEGHEIPLKGLSRPLWTESKAQLIRRYLRYFVFITHHGTYIDGFAGPQYPDKPEAWAAKLVLENEPRWLRTFLLCDRDESKLARLNELKRSDAVDNRTVEIHPGDFNEQVRHILAHPEVREKTATFCLLDQHTLECHWRTLEILARHKTERKIELFYFLAVGWLGRSLAALKDSAKAVAWWGHDDWDQFCGLRKQQVNDIFCNRIREELGYKWVLGWPILDKARGRTIMYYMIHATDHPEAPKLMNRAYNYAVEPMEPIEQLQLALPFEDSTGGAGV